MILKISLIFYVIAMIVIVSDHGGNLLGFFSVI